MTRSSVSIDLFPYGLTQPRKLGVAAEAKDALDHPALPVEQDRVGKAAIMKDRLHAAAADQNRERRAELPEKLSHLAAAHVVGDGRDVEVRTAEFAVQLRHVRELLAPGRARGGRELEELILAAIVGEPDGLAGHVEQRERWRERLAAEGGRLRQQLLRIEHPARKSTRL